MEHKDEHERLSQDELFADLASTAAYFFEQLPAWFQHRDELATKAVETETLEAVRRCKEARAELEHDFPFLLSRNLIELETILRGCLAGHVSLSEEELMDMARSGCRNLLSTNKNMEKKDFWFHCLEETADSIRTQLIARIKSEEKRYAEALYRAVAERMTADYMAARPALQKPYSVELDGYGKIITRPVIHNKSDFVYLGDAEAIRKTSESAEAFGPPDGLTLPVAIMQSFTKLGLLVYQPPISEELKQNLSAIVSNIIFHRLLVGLPDIKIVVYDSGLSQVSDYEHDLIHDLPKDPEAGDSIIERHSDFQSFTRQMNDLVAKQPENYERSHRSTGSFRRIRQLYSVLVIPETLNDERECQLMTEWICWYLRQFPRGVGLYLVTSLDVFGKFAERIDEVCKKEEWSLLALDAKGRLHSTGTKVHWAYRSASFLPSWAEHDWERGKEVLLKLINPPKPQAPGTISVFFAIEENGEPFSFRFTSQRANTIFISGSQGSGKTVALQFFIFRAAQAYSPDELQFYLFDYKNTLKYLQRLRHVAFLTTSTSEQITLGVLRDINAMMHDRQNRFREVEEHYKKSCQNLDDYNAIRAAHPEDGSLVPIPRTLVIVDECKNMLDAKSREITSLLCNELLTKCRSAGVHFLFATTEDIRSTVSKDKFDFTIRLRDEVHGRRKAKLVCRDEEYSGNGRDLTMPIIAKADIDGLMGLVESVNSRYASTFMEERALLFDQESGQALSAQKYIPFVHEFQRVTKRVYREISIGTGVDTRQLRQLHSITCKYQKSQSLAMFGDFKSSSFRGAVGLMLLSLAAASMHGAKVVVLDPNKRLSETPCLNNEGMKQLHDSVIQICSDGESCFEAKKEWLRATSPKETTFSSFFMVVLDAEETLQGEEDREALMPPPDPKEEAPQDELDIKKDDAPIEEPPSEEEENSDDDIGFDDGDLLANLREVNEQANALAPEPVIPKVEIENDEMTGAGVDRAFRDGAMLAKASLKGSYLILVSSRPRRLASLFDDSRTKLADVCRFLVFQTAQQLPGLENAQKDPGAESDFSSLGYYAETPGDDMPKDYFLPLGLDSLDAATLNMLFTDEEVSTL